MQNSRIQKLITFSPQLYELIERNAKKIGVSFPEYIRILAVNDVRQASDTIPYVDEETEERIGRSLKDIKNGKYTTVSTKEELEKFLNTL
ncbi:MAG: hypothetical protein KGJ07_00410 [Patescibacteria group bacterium]|nr:hypothetical protein [Patescibacteria group bacterium]MDE2589152.1 hypothetical protein [Patescibacteria group bacterium]